MNPLAEKSRYEDVKKIQAALKSTLPIDYTKLTWREMSEMVSSIHTEMKRRNPIGVNFYAGYVKASAELLDEISLGEIDNFTSEAGPKEPRRRKKK